MTRHQRNTLRSAFSLMELMVVVLIIGIIAAIVVPRVSAPTDAARQRVRDSHLTQMNQAIELYFLEKGQWPASLSSLEEDHLPDGVPDSPEGGAYSFNSTTMRAEHTP